MSYYLPSPSLACRSKEVVPEGTSETLHPSKDAYVVQGTFHEITCNMGTKERLNMRLVSKKFKEFVEKDPYWEDYVIKKNWVDPSQPSYFRMALLYKNNPLKGGNVLRQPQLRITPLGIGEKRRVFVCRRYLLVVSGLMCTKWSISFGVVKLSGGVSCKLPEKAKVISVCPSHILYLKERCLIGVPVEGSQTVKIKEFKCDQLYKVEYNEEYTCLLWGGKLHVIDNKNLETAQKYDGVVLFSLTPSMLYMVQKKAEVPTSVSVLLSNFTKKESPISYSLNLDNCELQGNIIYTWIDNTSTFREVDTGIKLMESPTNTDFMYDSSKRGNNLLMWMNLDMKVYNLTRREEMHNLRFPNTLFKKRLLELLYLKGQLIFVRKDGSCVFKQLKSDQEDNVPVNNSNTRLLGGHENAFETIALFKFTSGESITEIHILDSCVLFETNKNIYHVQLNNQQGEGSKI